MKMKGLKVLAATLILAISASGTIERNMSYENTCEHSAFRAKKVCYWLEILNSFNVMIIRK